MLIFRDDSILLAIILCALAVLSLSLYPSKSRLVLACTFFFAGIFVETLAVHFGIWSYPHPDMLGIPYWIPFLWLNGALAVAGISESIQRHFK